jgi:hypothetical protein
MSSRTDALTKDESPQESAEESRPLGIALGLGWTLAVAQKPRGANLCIRHANHDPVSIEIVVTANGPVVRASASSLELDSAEDILARCRRFRVEAKESVSIEAATVSQHATGAIHIEAASIDVDAKQGDIKLQAMDDMQLLGERVLLNCEREQPVPAWASPAQGMPEPIPRSDQEGDADLLKQTSTAKPGK